MGWLGRVLGKRDAASDLADSLVPIPAPRKAPVPPTTRDQKGYAVVDVETTGLSPRQHRVVAVAVVLLDDGQRVEHEWAALVHPQGPVGATHIHGILDADVAEAPTFDAVVPQLVPLLRGRVLVGHNVSFDSAFLEFEFGRAGWGWPAVPTLCTLDESFHFLPALDRRRLVDCCWASGIGFADAHSALGDARATAALLASYLDPSFGIPPLKAHRAILGAAADVEWPSEPGTGRIARPDDARRVMPARVRRQISAAPPRVERLLETFSLADAVDDGAPVGTLSYLETLVEVLEDGQITEDEHAALGDIVDLYGHSNEDVAAAHRGFVRALAREALEDGVLAREERAELRHVAALLDVDDGDVKDLLDGEEEERLLVMSSGLAPLPPGWAHGEPLRVGHRVAFTGCDDAERTVLEKRARTAGVRVTGSVSRRTAMLVTDGLFSGTKAATAAQLGTRLVHPQVFSVMLEHLQPHVGLVVEAAARQATKASAGMVVPTQHSPTSASHGPSPSDVRGWARRNGFGVGARGRLPAEVWDAYSAANN